MSTINVAGLCAVWRRQLGSLLGNPLGYVFILAFVLASSAYLLLFVGDKGDKFFTDNIADLGLMTTVMPWLLAVLLPALTMGAWASEREQGTEELLLTLPLSIVDAILGKYLAVVSYFTIALACNFLSMIFVLVWLGSPDFGLILANYFGWWLAGVVFAAWGIFASVAVSMPAIAFVLGLVVCGLVMYAAQGYDWFDAFNRGVIPFGGLVVAVTLIGAGIGLALLLLASRRWRPDSSAAITSNLIAAVLGLLLAANVARIGNRYGVDADVSVDGVASLSPTSAKILQGIEGKVTVAAFISRNLPPELEGKRKELEDKLQALKRLAGDRLKLEIYRPEDALDEFATLATKQYGLKSRKELVETESGKEFEEVFLGAAVTSAGRSQLIEYFDPGLSVEYELVRAVRTVSISKKKVLGIATTDLEINSGFNMQTYQMRQAWQIVDEWKRQYEVREVNLDAAVSPEVDVLVVPQPSSLTEPQMLVLHDYIWDGRPALLLEDPLPIWSGPTLNASQPKKGGQQSQFGGPPPEGPKKGDLKPLIKALGLDFDLNMVVWSSYNPSHQFRGLIPKNFAWVRRDQGGFSDSPITAGFQAMLMPFPGGIRVLADKSPGIEVKTLLKPSDSVAWGQHAFSEHVAPSMFGGMEQREPQRWRPMDPKLNPVPAFAVEVTGLMPSAYPKPDPAAAKKDDAKKDPAARPDEAPATKVGLPSPKPIHVIVVADSDFTHDAFFQFYRNAGNKVNGSEYKFLLDLRNVQFAANVVDALANDDDFLRLRARRVSTRPLSRIEEVYKRTQNAVSDVTDRAETEAQSEIDKKNQEFRDRLAKIDSEEGLDENAKANKKEQVQQVAQRELEDQLEGIKRQQELKVIAAKAEQRRIIAADRKGVRLLAILVPASLLAALVLMVTSNRLARERAHVPASRKRSQA